MKLRDELQQPSFPFVRIGLAAVATGVLCPIWTYWWLLPGLAYIAAEFIGYIQKDLAWFESTVLRDPRDLGDEDLGDY